MIRFRLKIIFWGSLIWLPQLLVAQCLQSTILLDIDASVYEARTSDIKEGMLLPVSNSDFFVIVAYMDLLKVDSLGNISAQIAEDELDAIASQYISKYHGDSAYLKRVRTELDDIICQHGIFWYRGMRAIENSDNYLVEIAVVVENGKKLQGDVFANLLFTVTVDADLQICSSAYLDEFRDIPHSTSLVSGSTNGRELSVRKKYYVNDSSHNLFINYILDVDVWAKDSRKSELQYSLNATTEFSACLPARLYHPKGWLYSNGKESHVLNDNDELVESWEVPDYDSLCIRDIVRIKDHYATISFEIKPRDEGAFDYTTYIWITDDYFNRQHLVSSYDTNRYFVTQLASRGEFLYVLVHDKITEKYLLQTFSMESKCPTKKFG